MSAVPDQSIATGIDDDRKLEELGYIPSFKREFSNLATVRPPFLHVSPLLTKPVQISFAFSIMVFPSLQSQISSDQQGRVPGSLF